MIYRMYGKRMVILSAVVMAVVLMIIGSVFVSDAASAEDAPTFKYFTRVEVEYGESLWTIAQEYKDDHYDTTRSYIDEVVRINHLTNADQIKAGQSLVVPYYSSEYK